MVCANEDAVRVLIELDPMEITDLLSFPKAVGISMQNLLFFYEFCFGSCIRDNQVLCKSECSGEMEVCFGCCSVTFAGRAGVR